MWAYNVSSGENQTIYAHFPLQTAKHTTEEWGLLDSGATHNFINIQTVIRLGIGTRRLKKPRTITNVDGTTNRARQINRYANLQFDYDRKTKDLPVFVTNLRRDRIILGLP
jgi:predicted aspartyl protease